MSEKEGRGELSCKEVSQQDHNLHIQRFLCNNWNHKFPKQSLQNKNKPNFLLVLYSNLMLNRLLQTLSHQKLSLLLHNLYTRNRLQKMIISTENLSCAKLRASQQSLHFGFRRHLSVKSRIEFLEIANNICKKQLRIICSKLISPYGGYYHTCLVHCLSRNNMQAVGAHDTK